LSTVCTKKLVIHQFLTQNFIIVTNNTIDDKIGVNLSSILLHDESVVKNFPMGVIFECINFREVSGSVVTRILKTPDFTGLKFFTIAVFGLWRHSYKINLDRPTYLCEKYGMVKNHEWVKQEL